ncbi:MAG: prepilin-type N-terminal cleavage/methylation domain-containing protein [Actinobacteria bacterium]|nr:prepilin-type N-terminal cleavage/methylation domain-containing protein [Actinomycetota bacterium]
MCGSLRPDISIKNEMLYQNNKSFTFIEILIVVSIVAVFSGLTLAFYNSYTQQQNLDRVAKKFVDVLQLAKSKADSPDDTTSICTTAVGDTIVGYYVQNISQTLYELFTVCHTGVPPGDTDYLKPINSFDISKDYSGILMSPSGATTGVRFLILSKGSTFSPAPYVIQFKNTNINPPRCVDISVSSTGVITNGSQYVNNVTCP